MNSPRRSLAPALVLALAAAPDLAAFGLFGQAEVSSDSDARSSAWMRLPAGVRADLARTLEPQLEGRASKHGMYADAVGRWRARPGAAEAAPGGPGSWSQHVFDEVLEAPARRGLLAVHAKAKAEGFWDLVGALGWIDAKGGSAGIDFDARGGHEVLRRRAEGLGYTADFMADDGRVWGLRSPEKGAQLHLRGPAPGASEGDRDLVQIHVDLNNPGRERSIHEVGVAGAALDYAFHGGVHVVEDLWRRGATHSPDALVAALAAQGIEVPDPELVELGGGELAMTELLKWDTDGGEPWGSWFGYLWVKPHAGQAGWWTKGEGSRGFDRVQLLSRGPREVVLLLEYGNGWVQATVEPGGALKAAWYQASSGEVRDFGGELVEGRVGGR